MVIPAEVRRRLGLREGDELSVEIDEREPRGVVLRRVSGVEVDRVLEAGARWLADSDRDLVEELHEQRRAERARERARRR